MRICVFYSKNPIFIPHTLLDQIDKYMHILPTNYLWIPIVDTISIYFNRIHHGDVIGITGGIMYGSNNHTTTSNRISIDGA